MTHEASDNTSDVQAEEDNTSNGSSPDTEGKEESSIDESSSYDADSKKPVGTLFADGSLQEIIHASSLDVDGLNVSDNVLEALIFKREGAVLISLLP